MLKLYWSPRSPFVRKVMVCAYELGIESRIEKVHALVSMAQVNPEVLHVNPVGRIPALVTETGTALYDSNVICEYLDAELGSCRFFPAEKPKRWQTLTQLALADGMLETAVLWRAERVKPAPQQSSPMLVAFERKILTALEAAENQTPPGKANEIDIGQIALGVALAYLDFRFVELDWRAHHADLALWFGWFADRRSMQETQPYQE